MEKSSIAQGQMFLHFDKSYMEKPRVWVKVDEVEKNEFDDEMVSMFVDNEVLVGISIGAVNVERDGVGIRDKWLISDHYYGKMVREGKFVPVDDLRKADDICEQMGWPKYEIDLGF